MADRLFGVISAFAPGHLGSGVQADHEVLVALGFHRFLFRRKPRPQIQPCFIRLSGRTGIR
jgi:hypothetical protein